MNKTCDKCGLTKLLKSFKMVRRSLPLKSGEVKTYEHRTRTCTACLSRRNLDLERIRAEAAGMNRFAWKRSKSNSFSVITLLSGCRRRAKKIGKTFSLKTADVYFLLEKQGGKCAVSGMVMDVTRARVGSGIPNPKSLSIDRIDNDLGYDVDNIRLVTYQANVCLNTWGVDSLIEFCKLMIEFSGGDSL